MSSRTKIVCTIGPASAKPEVLASLIASGMRVARLNMSHGTFETHQASVRLIREARKQAGKHVAILGDLQGPRIRVGKLPDDGMTLTDGETVELRQAKEFVGAGVIPVAHKKLLEFVEKGQRVFMDDGLIELFVTAVKDHKILAQVVHGGVLTSHKGINVPDTVLPFSSLTKKDKEDVAFLVAQKVDWIALSFVADPKDIQSLRRLIKSCTPEGQALPRIMIKIERQEAIRRFAELLEETDGVMVARGDLGIEINPAEVPIRQKQLVAKCRAAGKPVVVATHMLESMTHAPRPTRAEISDVANAVFDHTDAVMLSAETASGEYPMLAAAAMAEIIGKSEKSLFDNVDIEDETGKKKDLAGRIWRMKANDEIDAIISTQETLLLHHPEITLHLVVPSAAVARQNIIRWGVEPVVVKGKEEGIEQRAFEQLKAEHQFKPGMNVGLVVDRKVEIIDVGEGLPVPPKPRP
jgi:pyruvate kinase